ncbi:hypothetical protein BROUX41_004588 [Berkeleyomyces rouxiae]|uniref:uncharacterized protein n=1 Tax=Berkeleyomyces rouxiae TaxID=2035830 RepID=UPI003B827316
MDSQGPILPGSRLTPQLCFSTSTLQDFLRLSRATIDDSIQQRLNSLATPSRRGFDPSSTSQFYSRHEAIDASACSEFTDKILFPSWNARAEVLQYCSQVAAGPDPEDPDAARRAEELRRDKGRVVDERLDPYSGRFFPTQTRTEKLSALLKLEENVEHIVRMRTWEVVKSKCAGSEVSGQQAFAAWQKKSKQQQ